MTGFCWHARDWEYAEANAYISGEARIRDCWTCGATIEVRP